jgi:hypothetical protein
VHLAAVRVEPEQRADREQRRSGRPRLRLQRVRVLDRRFGPVAREAREDLRKLVAEALGRV